MTTFYLDPEDGNDANDGTTFANRWQTILSGATAARTAPGDIIRIIANRRSSIGSCSWTNGSNTVTLPSALTQVITNCESNWTAASQVTASLSTTLEKEGSNAVALAIAAAFSSGRVAHFATGTLDLSGYQQVSFYFRTTTAQPSGRFTLRLCSDTGGVTAVNTFTIPQVQSTNVWHVFTLDNAANLGSAIQSVALYAASDPGTVTITLDHIIACKDKDASDCLTLSHLIKKSADTSFHFYPIRSIDGTTVTLETSTLNMSGANGEGYHGTTESVTTIALKPHVILFGEVTNYVPNEGGTIDNLITFVGGYNRTDMSSQSNSDDMSIFDVLGYTGADGFNLLNADYIRMERVGMVRGQNGFYDQSSFTYYLEVIDCYCALLVGTVFRVTGFIETRIVIHCCAIVISTSSGNSDTISGSMRLYDTPLGGTTGSTLVLRLQTLECYRRTGVTVAIAGPSLGSLVGHIDNLIVENNSTVFQLGNNAHNLFINGGHSSNNTNLFALIYSASQYHFRNFTVNEASIIGTLTALSDVLIEFKDLDDTSNNHYAIRYGGEWLSETTVRHTASGIAWKMNVTSSNLWEGYPLRFPLGPILCAANEEVTLSVWLRRTNTGISGKLILPGGQIAGVASDVEDAITAAADTWEQQTITFTPTEAGVIRPEIHAWGGTTYSLYVDDLSVSQEA